MHGEQTASRTLDLVEAWIPSDEFGHEREFQSELQEYLDKQLNSGGGMGLGMDSTHVVSTEHGRSKGDVVVDDSIGIELKRNLSNDQVKKLRGQIESYRDEYDYVIACACGIEDMDGWRRLQREYGDSTMGVGIDQKAPVRFVHKERSTFGTGEQPEKAVANSAGNADLGDLEKQFQELPPAAQIAVLVIVLGFLAYFILTNMVF